MCIDTPKSMVKRKDEAEKVKPRTKRAKRMLEKREPKLVCTAPVPCFSFDWHFVLHDFLVLNTFRGMTGGGSEDRAAAAWQQN